MVANVAVSALNLVVLQAGTWDLRSMWGSMSIIAKTVVFHPVHFVGVVSRRDD